MGKKKTRHQTKGWHWMPEDIKQLKELYPREFTWKVAKIMGRTKAAVYRKAIDLKLTKTKKFRREMLGHNV